MALAVVLGAVTAFVSLISRSAILASYLDLCSLICARRQSALEAEAAVSSELLDVNNYSATR